MKSFLDPYIGRFCLGLLLLVAFCVKAEAQVAWDTNVITITPPTACTTGEPVSACPVTAYRIYRAASQTGTFLLVTTLTPPTVTYTQTGVAAGQNCYYVVAAAASGDSDHVTHCKTNTKPVGPPNAPDFTVAQVDIRFNAAPAYRYTNGQRGEFIAMVPVGTDCSSPVLFRKNGYSFRAVVLKPADVTWQTAGPAPKTAAAPCVRLGS